MTIGLSSTLFGGLGRVIGRVKHWLWQRMDIEKSKNAQIGAEEHGDEVGLPENGLHMIHTSTRSSSFRDHYQ